MPRARNIKPGFFTSDELADVSAFGRLLFIGLWTIADKEGRLEYRPKRIKALLLPYDDVNIEHEVSSLVACGFLESYTVDGCALLEVCNWHKHQRPHHKEVESELPPPQSPENIINIHAKAKHDSSMVHARTKHDSLGECEHGDNPPDTGYRIPDTGLWRATKRVPKKWSVKDAGIAYALKHGMSESVIKDEIEGFRDHEYKTARKDWDAVWRTWCRNWKKFGGKTADVSRCREL